MDYTVLITLFLIILISFVWSKEKKDHTRYLKNIEIRVHVNGTRGKSTVTRIIGSILTEAGFRTFVKTTGSDTRLILPDRSERQIFRFSANIGEQIKIIDLINSFEPQAIVFECMAVRPVYQKICEEEMIKSTTGIITNIRSDHQDVMGETLEEMADSLSNTIPQNGVLIVGDISSDLLNIIEEKAKKKNTIVVKSYEYKKSIPEDYILKFNYFAYEENVAIGLAFCDALDIDREVGLRGILKANPDPGVLKFYKKKLTENKEILFINLHAINDKESAVSTYNLLKERGYIRTSDTKIAILNHRKDRAFRIDMFSDICTNDMDIDFIFCIGDLQKLARRDLIKKGFDKSRIIEISDNKLETLLQVIKRVIKKRGVIIGMVNIHGELSDKYIPFFEGEKESIKIIAP